MTEDICNRCLKQKRLCVCTDAEPFDNKHFVLILQHPQEEDKELGTAGILISSLKNSKLEIALSRPSLKSILNKQVDLKKWGTLYLGAQNETPAEPGLYVLSRKGGLHSESEKILNELEGVILLDGTWKQAKALWWRNPWLLKTRRLVLVPERRSLYGKMRKEPRKESVSTLEACAGCLTLLGENEQLADSLICSFKNLLDKCRALHDAP